ncbi:MAG: cyclic-di-AMP receptor [Erysipelotrichaceae bacterium]|nr:cyclic-di-AMP receptor [Erysipelotrichaceae bacterium]
MKLILAIISNDDTKACTSALNKASYHVTRLATTGGFLSSGNTTLLIGCEDEKVEHAIEIIGSESKRRKEAVPASMSMDMSSLVSYPIEVEIGGATIFILNVENFIKL